MFHTQSDTYLCQGETLVVSLDTLEKTETSVAECFGITMEAFHQAVTWGIEEIKKVKDSSISIDGKSATLEDIAV